MKDKVQKKKDREKRVHEKVLKRRACIRCAAKKERREALLEKPVKVMPIRNDTLTRAEQEILEQNLGALYEAEIAFLKDQEDAEKRAEEMRQAAATEAEKEDNE